MTTDNESHDDDVAFGGTYLTLRAEGNLCYLKSKYYYAIEFYTRALEIHCTDCDVFIRRGWCHLQLCNTKVALKDVEQAQNHITHKYVGRVCLLRAEILYAIGEFEQALIFFNRGKTMKPSVYEFELGIAKCREAIGNCVGGPDRIKLTLQGDLAYFESLSESKKMRMAQRKRTQSIPANTRSYKDVTKQVASEKTIQQLLGQIYDDKVFLEKLYVESGKQMQYDDVTVTLLGATLIYMKRRVLFWQQQNPIYSRRHDKKVRDRRRPCAVNDCTYLDKFLAKELEKVHEDIRVGHLAPALRRAYRSLNTLKQMDRSTPLNRAAFGADVHGLIGSVFFEANQLTRALAHSIKAKNMAARSGVRSCQKRALENLAKIYILQEDYTNAVQVWVPKLDFVDDVAEHAWLCHDIGRCYLELDQKTQALQYGSKAMSEAADISDKNALLSSKILIAQANAKLCDYTESREMYENALVLAQSLGKRSMENLIKQAVEMVLAAEAERAAVERAAVERAEVERAEVERSPEYLSLPSPSLSSTASIDELSTEEDDNAGPFVSNIAASSREDWKEDNPDDDLDWMDMPTPESSETDL